MKKQTVLHRTFASDRDELHIAAMAFYALADAINEGRLVANSASDTNTRRLLDACYKVQDVIYGNKREEIGEAGQAVALAAESEAQHVGSQSFLLSPRSLHRRPRAGVSPCLYREGRSMNAKNTRGAAEHRQNPQDFAVDHAVTERLDELLKPREQRLMALAAWVLFNELNNGRLIVNAGNSSDEIRQAVSVVETMYSLQDGIMSCQKETCDKAGAALLLLAELRRREEFAEEAKGVVHHG